MLDAWLQIEIALIPIALTLVGGLIWVIRLEGRINQLKSAWAQSEKASGEKIQLLVGRIESEAKHQDQMFKLNTEALHARDDSAKERDTEMKRDLAEMKRDVSSINTNVAVLMSDLERNTR